MTGREQVDRLTRAANAKVRESIRLGESPPPWWRYSERREVARRRRALLDEAQMLIDRASRIAVEP